MMKIYRPDKLTLALSVFLTFWIFFIDARAQTNPTLVESFSPDHRFKLTLSPGELTIQSAKDAYDTQVLTGEFASESGQIGNVEWSNDSKLILISSRAGAHNQYSAQTLYSLSTIAASEKTVWAFHPAPLLSRLGSLAQLDPNHDAEKWDVAAIRLAPKGILVDLFPIGRNSQPFDFESDHYYKAVIVFKNEVFKISKIFREPGEMSKEEEKVVWTSKE